MYQLHGLLIHMYSTHIHWINGYPVANMSNAMYHTKVQIWILFLKLLKSTFGGVHNTALQAWHSSTDNISTTELLAINIVHSIQTRLENALQWVHACVLFSHC